MTELQFEKAKTIKADISNLELQNKRLERDYEGAYSKDGFYISVGTDKEKIDYDIYVNALKAQHFKNKAKIIELSNQFFNL